MKIDNKFQIYESPTIEIQYISQIDICLVSGGGGSTDEYPWTDRY